MTTTQSTIFGWPKVVSALGWAEGEVAKIRGIQEKTIAGGWLGRLYWRKGVISDFRQEHLHRIPPILALSAEICLNVSGLAPDMRCGALPQQPREAGTGEKP